MDLGILTMPLFYALVYGVPGVVLLFWFRNWRHVRTRTLGKTTFPSIAAIVDDLTARLGLRRISSEARPVPETLDGVVIDGLLPRETRRASVGFFRASVGSVYARFKLDVDPAIKVSLRRREWGPADAVLLTRGAYVLGTDDAARFDNALARDPALARAIDGAFALGVEQLLIWDGELRADVPLGKLEPAQYPELLSLLERIVGCFDPIAIRVKVLGDRELRALKGAHGEARCSYCHDHVTGDESDLVACASCNTVLHDACWQELGRCPVLGCSGSVPERGRVATR
jgi:hypothetical protein